MTSIRNWYLLATLCQCEESRESAGQQVHVCGKEVRKGGEKGLRWRDPFYSSANTCWGSLLHQSAAVLGYIRILVQAHPILTSKVMPDAPLLLSYNTHVPDAMKTNASPIQREGKNQRPQKTVNTKLLSNLYVGFYSEVLGKGLIECSASQHGKHLRSGWATIQRA